MSTGLALFLIAVGAILRVAVTRGSLHDLNLHTVGVILIVIGALGLLLRMTAAGRPLDPRPLSPLIRPRGRDNPLLEEIERAAAEDDATIQEDARSLSGPGRE
jgi:hypothetical protein